MYYSHNTIIQERKKEADYSSVVPIAFQIRYITPNGKIAYKEIDINDTTKQIETLQTLLNQIATETSTPPIIIE